MTALDRNISLRLDMDLRHRVEKRCADLNAKRAALLEKRPEFVNGVAPTVFTVSDVIRRALNIGLDILEGDEDAIRDWIGPIIESDLKRILAARYHDSEAMELLRRIASENTPDPDFG